MQLWWHVQGETVDSWKEKLPEIIHGYDKDDVWNMDGLLSLFKKYVLSKIDECSEVFEYTYCNKGGCQGLVHG